MLGRCKAFLFFPKDGVTISAGKKARREEGKKERRKEVKAGEEGKI